MPGDILGITSDVVLPIFLMAGIGLLSRTMLGLDPRPLAGLGVYVLMPALLFNSLTSTTMQGDEVTDIGVFTVGLLISLVGGSLLMARLLRVGREETSALTLTVAFMSSVNYGLPVCLFAFGPEGFERAAVFAAFQSICTGSVAVMIAAKGERKYRTRFLSRAISIEVLKTPGHWRAAIDPVLRMPVLWVALLAFAVRGFELTVPVPIQRGISVLADGAIPITVLSLGMQLASLRFDGLDPRTLMAAAGRLAVSPAVAMILVAFLHPSELTAKVLVIQAATPTAVNIALYALQFNVQPQLVASIVIVTTAVSMLSVSVLVSLLGGAL